MNHISHITFTCSGIIHNNLELLIINLTNRWRHQPFNTTGLQEIHSDSSPLKFLCLPTNNDTYSTKHFTVNTDYFI